MREEDQRKQNGQSSPSSAEGNKRRTKEYLSNYCLLFPAAGAMPSYYTSSLLRHHSLSPPFVEITKLLPPPSSVSARHTNHHHHCIWTEDKKIRRQDEFS
ncbi:hypothetical protein E2C01_068842 [Portunus trituberculatus]|uniref:Uncharacterized protein n=1 Tax=Portunus trituberculatus TaxID=210409 RepID=A0A5B7HT33_PORTR|nr:hypothetical protein [Portunus trituberculatus]